MATKRIILIIPACIFFFNRSRSSPSFDAHRFIKCSSLPEITQTNESSSATSLEMESPCPEEETTDKKRSFFKSKCRKYTIIHKCQHPIKSFLQV